MREHNNSIPSLIRDFESPYYTQNSPNLHITFREKLLLLMIQNLNERILALEHEQILKDDGKNQ